MAGSGMGQGSLMIYYDLIPLPIMSFGYSESLKQGSGNPPDGLDLQHKTPPASPSKNLHSLAFAPPSFLGDGHSYQNNPITPESDYYFDHNLSLGENSFHCKYDSLLS